MAVRIRPVRVSERSQVDSLLSAVFSDHSRKVGSMVREFAYVYARANLRLCLGAFARGRLVAHAAARRGTLIVHDRRVGWASYGNVATLPEARGQGIAGRLGREMFRRLRATGVDLVYISGTRSLYTRAGAAECGAYRRFEIRVGRGLRAGSGLTATPAGEDAAAEIVRMLAADPVRFADDVATVRSVLRTGWVQCRRASTWFVRFRGRPVAFAVTGGPDWSPSGAVVLVGGVRLALAAALPEIVRRAGRRALPVTVPAWDAELVGLLGGAHGAGSPVGLQGPGTILILNAPRLMRLAGIRGVVPQTPHALAAVTREIFGVPGRRPARLPLPLVGLHYM